MAQPSSEHSYAELRRRGAGMCRGNRVQRCAELGLIEFAWVCSLGICLHLFELVWALQKFWVVSGHCSHWPGDKLPAIASKCRRGMVGRASHGWFMLAYLRVGCLHVWIHWRGCTPPAAYILGSTWKNIAGPSSSSSKSSKARLSTRNLCWRRHHRWLDFVVLGLWLCSWFVVQSRGEVWSLTSNRIQPRPSILRNGFWPKATGLTFAATSIAGKGLLTCTLLTCLGHHALSAKPLLADTTVLLLGISSWVVTWMQPQSRAGTAYWTSVFECFSIIFIIFHIFHNICLLPLFNPIHHRTSSHIPIWSNMIQWYPMISNMI